MALRLITPPEDLVVTVVEAKRHLRIDTADHDTLIEFYIRAATRNIDGNTFYGRALRPQTWELVYDAFPWDPIKIPLPPLIEIVSVKYIDEDGAEQTVSSADYEVDTASQPGWLLLGANSSWPSTMQTANAVRIRFKAGYLDTIDDMLPENIKLAVLLMVGDAFAQRETVSAEPLNEVPMSMTIRNLLAGERMFW